MSEPIVEQYDAIYARSQRLSLQEKRNKITVRLAPEVYTNLCPVCQGRNWYLDTSDSLAGRSVPCKNSYHQEEAL